MNQVHLLSNSTAGHAIATMQGASRCSAPASGASKAGEVTGSNSLSNFKSAVGPPGQGAIAGASGSVTVGRQPNGPAGQQDGSSASVTRPGPLLATGHGARGSSEGQVKSGPAAQSLTEHSRNHPNQMNTPASTLLQNRKEQQQYLSGPGAGSAPGSLAQGQPTDQSKQMNKAPSGKDIGQKSLLNLQTVSKSVDKQTTGQGSVGPSKSASGQGNQQQYLVINSSKEIKVRDSAKRRREASGASNGGASTVTNGATLKEKRLSQHQAQQFVNNQ